MKSWYAGSGLFFVFALETPCINRILLKSTSFLFSEFFSFFDTLLSQRYQAGQEE